MLIAIFGNWQLNQSASNAAKKRSSHFAIKCRNSASKYEAKMESEVMDQSIKIRFDEGLERWYHNLVAINPQFDI